MGDFFGGGNKTSTQVNDPWASMPQWLRDTYREEGYRAEDIYNDSEAVAAALAKKPRKIGGVNSNETRAVRDMINENKQAQRLYGEAADLEGLMEMYENPWTEDVVDTTLAGMDRYQDREQMMRAAQEAAVGGPNNTRMGVADAIAQQLGGMDRATMEAQLRSQGFNTAAGLGQSASGILQNVAAGGMNSQQVASQFQGTLGETQRRLKQEQLDENRTSGQQADTWLAQMFNATKGPPAPTGGSTTSTVPGPGTGQQVLGTAATVAGIWSALSDEDAKEDILVDLTSGVEKLRKIPTYEYSYKKGLGHTRDRTAGVIAQDIEQAGIKGAVHVREDGLKEVDALPVLATVIQAVRELDVRTAGLNG